MLLFDDSKKLEKALGEEAAAVIAHVFEKADEKWRQELATKADLQEMRNDMIERIAETKTEIQGVKFDLLKWMIGLAVGQLAFIMALFAFMK